MRENYLLYNGPKGYYKLGGSAMKKIFITVADYIWRHLSMMLLMAFVFCIGLCNPFVVDKYQVIYRYHVSVIGSAIWDVVWFIGCVGCGFLEHFIRKCEQ